MENPNINPYFTLNIGGVCISVSAVLVKEASAPSGVTAIYKLLFTVLFMLPVFLYKYVEEIKVITKRGQLFSIISGKVMISCLLAVSGRVIKLGSFRKSGIALCSEILALIASVLVTAYMMFGQTLRKRISLVTYTFVVYTICTAVLFIDDKKIN